MPITAPHPSVTPLATAPTLRTSPLGSYALCPDPVFILGAPRSGTSILAWALAQHPRLCGGAESNLLHHLFGDRHIDTAFEALQEQHGSSWLREAGVERDAFLRYVGLGINALYTSRSDGRRWIEKSVPNTLMANVIGEMFPGGSFIHIVRDGRQVVHSMVNAGFPDPTISDFPSACRTWRTFVELADAFCAADPYRSLTVYYERLIASPELEFRRILRFLDLEDDGAPADYVRSHRINSSFASAPQGPAGQKAGWRAWTDEQRQIFWEVAGTTLREHYLVSPEELDALRPAGAEPLLTSTPVPDAAECPPIPFPSATRSWQRQHRAVEQHLRDVQGYVRALEQQIQEQTVRVEELSATRNQYEAAIGKHQTVRAEQVVQVRPPDARLARRADSRPARLAWWAGRMLSTLRWRAAT
jgi:hypothetical protein